MGQLGCRCTDCDGGVVTVTALSPGLYRVGETQECVAAAVPAVPKDQPLGAIDGALIALGSVVVAFFLGRVLRFLKF